jgi:hypothetical protein
MLGFFRERWVSNHAFFHEEPSQVILLKNRVLMVHESIINEGKITESGQHFTGEVSFEEALGMTTVGDFDGNWVIVLSNQNVSPAGPVNEGIDIR